MIAILQFYTEIKHIAYMTIKKTVKSKAIPAQASTGPEGSRRFRLQDFKTVGT
jgi:hypothetical protein